MFSFFSRTAAKIRAGKTIRSLREENEEVEVLQDDAEYIAKDEVYGDVRGSVLDAVEDAGIFL